MAFDPGAVGRAFSEHRFDEALGHLAKDVRWTIVGYMVLEGADAVRQTCRETLESLADTTTTYDRCVVAAGSDAVAVDTFARYSGPKGTTAVASCDIYEFTGDEISAITSYAVEIDPESAGAQPPRGVPKSG
jgi:ketosteroid isomerase-like protein